MLRNPRILMAFADDEFHPNRKLGELKAEMLNLSEILQSKMEVTLKPAASRSVITKAFKELGEDIRIFHFAGHASGEGIQTVESQAERQITFAEGLADFIGQQKGVKLVFLNGCATKGQVQFFHASDIPAVIATSVKIGDRQAREFAEAFYDSLAKDRTIRQAFEEARAEIKMAYKDHQKRDVVFPFEEGEDPNALFPYSLEIDHRFESMADETLASWQEDVEFEGPLDQPLSIRPRDLHLLCDRENQKDEFEDALEEGQKSEERSPQIFFIHGNREDLPHSLADRLFKFSVRELFEIDGKPLTEEKYDLVPIKLPGASAFEGANTKKPWLHFLRNFKKKGWGEPQSGRDLIPLIDSYRHVMVFQHSIVAGNWHPNLEKFLSAYLQNFWSFSLDPDHPHLLILIDITYSPPVKGVAGFFRKNPNPKIEKTLERLAQNQAGALLLKRLPLVTSDDVEQWRIDHLPTATGLTQAVCGEAEELPMERVQPKLKDQLTLHNQRYT